MKYGRILTVIAGLPLTALVVISCVGGGGGGGGDGGDGGGSVTLSGDFSPGAHAKWLTRALNWVIPSAMALDPNVVTQVVVFNVDGGYYTAPVENGAFSIAVDTGAPVGIVFAGAGDNFLGYLTLSGGIDSLPLTKLESGVSAIDLQTLSSNGLIVEPSHNPLGSEVPLSSAEQAAVARGDDFFAAAVKNADMDGDGKVDALTAERYFPQILYFVNAGSFGGDLEGDPTTPAAIASHKLALHAVAATRPASVTFTGPGGGYPLSGSASGQANVYSDSTTYFSPLVNSPELPPAGTYTVDYGGKTLTYQVPDQSGAPNSVVLPVPVVTLNGGVVQQVSWSYKLGSGAGSALDPAAIISAVELQIDGTGAPCATYPQPNRMYNSGSLAVTATSHTLECNSVQWSDVTAVYMTYNDIYGNHFVATWSK